jgi:hypothetical protein
MAMPTPSTAQAGENQSGKSLCGTEQDKPRRQNQIGDRQHAATAAIVDRAADGRT